MMGGFEACNALTEHGHRHDLLHATRHDIHCRSDYRLLKEQGIYTVREGLAWNQIDKAYGQYDFSRFEAMMEIGREEGMQIIWSLNHFDFPEDIDLFSPSFIARFTNYAFEAVKVIRKYEQSELFIIPINEISFLSFMCGEGRWAPFVRNRSWEAKIQMAKATISAINVIKSNFSRVYFIHCDPVMRRTSRHDAPYKVKRFITDFHEVPFQAWDIISGKIHPEFGGSSDLIDVVGLNYYISNQEMVSLDLLENFAFTSLSLDSKYRIEFYQLIYQVYQRYGKPIVITETGSYGSLRKAWWQQVFVQVKKAFALTIPLKGVCAYPVIDRPDWNGGHLTHSGLWDFEPGDPDCKRIPQIELLKMIGSFTSI